MSPFVSVGADRKAMLLVVPAPVTEKFSPAPTAGVPKEPKASVLTPAVVASCTVPAPALAVRIPIISLLPALFAL